MTTATAKAANVSVPRPSLAHRALHARETPVLSVLIVTTIVTTAINSQFLSAQGVRDLLLSVSFIALMAVGETFVIMMRHVDLSVGSTMGMATYFCAVAVRDVHGVPLLVMLGTGILVGFVVGLVNGLLVALLRLPALVVTLSTLYIVQGLRNLLIGPKRFNPQDLPKVVVDIGTGTWLGIPWLMWVVVVVAAIATPAARYTRFGRDLYAMGSNPEAAQRVGIPVTRRTIGAFVVCGVCAGIAGAVLLSRFGGTDANAGDGTELSVVAACVVGGVFIFGGSGSPWGAVVGALLLKVLALALLALRAPEFWQQALVGALIIGAISIDRVAVVRAERQRRRESRR